MQLERINHTSNHVDGFIDKSRSDCMAKFELPKWMIDDAGRIREDPAFEQSLVLYGARFIEQLTSAPLVLRILSEEARYLTFIALLTLHYSRRPEDESTGATLSRLQAFAQHHQLTGPNRVSAIVAVMRHAGYVEQITTPVDRRIKRLNLTAKGIELAEYCTLTMLQCIQAFSKNDDLVQLHQEDPDFVSRFYVERIKLYSGGARIVSANPECLHFVNQIAGREVMFLIWQTLSEKSHAQAGAVSLPYNKIAKGFGVSRGHVRRIFEDGERLGFFRILAAGGQLVEVTDSFVKLHRNLTSFELALSLKAANIAANKTGRGDFIDWSRLHRKIDGHHVFKEFFCNDHHHRISR